VPPICESEFKKCIDELLSSSFFISNTLVLFRASALKDAQLQGRRNPWRNDLGWILNFCLRLIHATTSAKAGSEQARQTITRQLP
jgi:hypothetical protein